jgi:hypothetical protein
MAESKSNITKRSQRRVDIAFELFALQMNRPAALLLQGGDAIRKLVMRSNSSA